MQRTENAIVSAISYVSKDKPCEHCGKPDWCYVFGNGASVCNRGSIGIDYEDSGKKDKAGSAILYPILWNKEKPKPQVISSKEWHYPDRQGNPLAMVSRLNYDDGSKEYPQKFWNGKNWVFKKPKGMERSDFCIYRYAQIREAISLGKTIFICEGEKVADKLVDMGFEATTNIQGSKNFAVSDCADLEGASRIVLVPDRDTPGLKLMAQWADNLSGITWLYPYPEKDWKNVPPSNGLDFFDWITDLPKTAQEIEDAIGLIPDSLKKIEVKTSTPLEPVHSYVDDSNPDQSSQTNQEAIILPPSYGQFERAVMAIYGKGKYLSHGGELFKYNGKFYEKLETELEYLKIRDWARNDCEWDNKEKRYVYKYLTPASLDGIWKWALIVYAVSSKRINPPGLNLSNGILTLYQKGKEIKHELLPHSPDKYFLYCSDVEFTPDADPKFCDQLLEALDPPERKIFVQTLAAGLDLAWVRKHQGRIKAIIAKGSGSNGKDSIKNAIVKIFTQEQLCNVPFSSFKAYDNGQKYDLTKLRDKKVNWSSENNQTTVLDRSESLNCAITGNGIDYRDMNKLPKEFEPVCINIFNVNLVPKATGGLESFLSRFAVIEFTKTFANDPDPSQGQIQADSRFAYDPEFMRSQVCPALLNLLLSEFPNVVANGIDYSPLKKSLNELQEDSNHLWGFVRDFNIVADPNGRIYISDLWIALKQWYETNGTLEISTLSNGEKKEIWHEQSNKYDKNVVASNQVAKRLKELFPKAKTGSETRDTKRKKATFLAGVKFSDNHNESTTSLLHHSDTESILASPTASLPFTSLHQEKGEAKSEAVTQDGEAKTLTESQSEAVKQNDQPAAAPSRFMERNGHHLGSGVIVMDAEGTYYQIVGERLLDKWPTVIYESRQPFQLPDASIFMVLEE
jgi:putative DNA primase/helicase